MATSKDRVIDCLLTLCRNLGSQFQRDNPQAKKMFPGHLGNLLSDKKAEVLWLPSIEKNNLNLQAYEKILSNIQGIHSFGILMCAKTQFIATLPRVKIRSAGIGLSLKPESLSMLSQIMKKDLVTFVTDRYSRRKNPHDMVPPNDQIINTVIRMSHMIDLAGDLFQR